MIESIKDCNIKLSIFTNSNKHEIKFKNHEYIIIEKKYPLHEEYNTRIYRRSTIDFHTMDYESNTLKLKQSKRFHKISGKFEGLLDSLSWIENYKDCSNDKIKNGDVIRCKHNEHYSLQVNDCLRLDGQYDDDNYMACVGLNPSVFMELDSNGCSISGGPFPSIPKNEIFKTSEVKEVYFWSWGLDGAGGRLGVDYKEKVRIWEWRKLGEK